MKKTAKKLEDLPSSDDREFWGEDAEMHRIDTSKPEAHFDLENKIHKWKQKGAFIVCDTCPLKHSFYVGVKKQLIGIDDKGKPMFKKVEF